MEYELKIRQSYHGNGGRDGYRFKVYNDKGKKLGEIANLPNECNVGDSVQLNGKIYEITRIYSSSLPREEKSEVMYYELNPYQFQPTHDIGYLLH